MGRIGTGVAIAAAALALVGSPGPAGAQGTLPARAFGVPAGLLDATLLAFARAAGLRLAADAGVLSGRRSEGVDGRLPPRAALDRVLAGTGLAGRIERGTVLVATPVELPALRVDAEAPPVRLAQAGGGMELPQIDVTGRGAPPTSELGPPPPAYAGGQVARGGRVGLLGNRDYMETPFSTSSYTEEYIRNRQARTLFDVFADDPSARQISPRFSGAFDALYVRGFQIFDTDAALNGLAGVLPPRRSPIETYERVELVRGPAGLLTGTSSFGSVAGSLNYTSKFAPDAPLNRFTGTYFSQSNLGGAVDVARRFDDANQWGVRFNGVYRDGSTPLRDSFDRTGEFALIFDYRGERLRVLTSVNYLNSLIQATAGALPVSTGTILPKVPDNTRVINPP